MIMVEVEPWQFYLQSEEVLKQSIPNAGKWMYFWKNDTEGRKFIQSICKIAVENGVVPEAKHTIPEFVPIVSRDNSGVACFYIDGTDRDAHRRVIEFFLKNNMIPKTKAGKLHNIAFKFDEQTKMGEYGSDFQAKLNLGDFVNLKTGDFL